MLGTKWISVEDFEDTKVYYMVPKDAMWRSDMREINSLLVEKCEAEATKLYRLAWRMKAHGCSPESIAKCREEANSLHMNAYPWQVLNPFNVWTYAFKY